MVLNEKITSNKFLARESEYGTYIFNNTYFKNDSTILDGEIGEWDPELDDNPDFDGEKIERLEKGIYHNIVLYGKFVKK